MGLRPAIHVVSLGKEYVVGRRAALTFRETVSGFLQRRLTRAKKEETFWALKGVSFDVPQGEVLGIIGRNGAGKSTLLKILSRITEPTEGRVDVFGRVGSLLEVGTGFHPDLTGRDNVFMNAAILGMRRSEIRRKFDEIVDFAQVEKFIDTPVKHYSSGMYMRLAFAVAAHMEPDILIIDEVLAVGDMQFQKKCLGKMGQIAGQGRTVLLVSHNLQAVRALCRHAVVLESGRMVKAGGVEECIQAYKALISDDRFGAGSGIGDDKVRRGTGAARFTSVQMYDARGQESSVFRTGESMSFQLTFDVIRPVEGLDVSIGIRSGHSRDFVTTIHHRVSNVPIQPATGMAVTIAVEDLALRPGDYPTYFNLTDHMGMAFDVVDDLTPSLVVTTDSTFDELGYDPASPVGFFSLRSRIAETATGGGGKREETA